MQRKIYQELLNWKNNNIETPLMIIGARQTGKTYIINEFCQNEFKHYVYINLLEHKDIIALFKQELSLQDIYEQMLLRLDIKSNIEETILFFDEIQESEELISALKFFQEHKTKFIIICAGSLLGVKLKRFNSSFPVGKVKIKYMYPLTFEEFLTATNHESWITEIKEHTKNGTPLIIHDKILKLYRLYLCTGGMPEAIKELKKINYDILNFKGEIIEEIIFSYLADMNKYIYNKKEAVKIEELYRSIPKQLANNSNKFQYNKITDTNLKHGKREYETSLEWLLASNLIYKSDLITRPEIPLTPFIDEKTFKLYINDIGILTKLLNIKYNDILLDTNFMYKGIIAENFIASELSAYNKPLYFWNSNNSAEIDFLIYNNDGIIPIEVKAGNNTQSKSLKVYIEKYKPKYSIRLSTKNFGIKDNIKSIPIYAIFALLDY